jgi:heterodisulfide reductase subunit C/nitrate reductase gamma subunit
MEKQIIFLIELLITAGIFTYSMYRYFQYFKFTKPKKIGDWGKRIMMTIEIAFLQKKILRRHWVGTMHALVWWGFILILFGSIEMIFDGILGTEKLFSALGGFYRFMMASGDVFALIIAVAIIAFLIRRLFMHIKRFYGPEMRKIDKLDANFALTLILLLMISLIGMNTFYIVWAQQTGNEILGAYPVSNVIAKRFLGIPSETAWFWYQFNWWAHISLVFLFANILPYSKHFHVFMSVPNVFVSRLEPLGYVDNMESITKEVKIMLDPDAAFEEPAEAEEENMERFGIKDIEDVTWVSYLNSLACTQCGRCVDVCPANITGKLLSPRKVMMDTRKRMKEKGPEMIKEGTGFDDGKALLGNFITEEELWACTLCNACAMECPVNNHQPTIILGMRRYLVMEESKAPTGLNTVFANIENNGAPWQFSPEDRLLWAKDLEMNVVD